MFAQACVEIDGLIQQAQAGEIELAYVDETGFAPQPPNRSAWGKKGETHAVTAKRSQRLNVIGALLYSGRLIMAKRQWPLIFRFSHGADRAGQEADGCGSGFMTFRLQRIVPHGEGTGTVLGTPGGESLFLRKLVLRMSCPATLVPYPTRGMGHHCAMTRRDFGWLCNFTPQTTLREIAQPLSLLRTKNLHSASATFPRFSALDYYSSSYNYFLFLYKNHKPGCHKGE